MRATRRLALLLVGIALVFFFVVPREVGRRMNRTRPGGPHPVSERARELHRRLLVADLHADSLLWGRDLLQRGSWGHVDVPRLLEGNVALQGFSVVTEVPRGLNIERNAERGDLVFWLALAERWPPSTWRSLRERALYQARSLTDAAAASGGRLTLVRTRSELDAVLLQRREGRQATAALLGIEGAHALDGDVGSLDALYAAGFRMLGLAHFFDNDMAGSAHGEQKYGLTPKGQKLVAGIEARGMILDLAHASAAAVDDALAIATRPVVVSHTGVKGTCDNARNLTDAQLRAVAAGGGLVGIGYWETAVCGQDAKAIARAIRHAVDVAGVEHVGLGSDFDGAVTTPFDAAGLVELTDALLADGFSTHEIERVMGGNEVDLLRTLLPR